MERGIIGRFILLALGVFLLTLSIVYSASSEPTGPNSVTVINASRGLNSSGPITIQAEAGNVTELAIFDERNTEAWQGYYGSVTGNITLEDSNGNVFYNWQLANPRGEIYAANGTTTTWASMYCVNVSQNGTSDGASGIPRPDGSFSSFNGSYIEKTYGINETDLDGLNETYYQFFTGSFFTGNLFFDSSDGCSMATPYSSSSPSAVWENVILSDNDTLVFASIIEENATAFNGVPHDFQLLVLENGHTGWETTTTPYYFYVELS